MLVFLIVGIITAVVFFNLCVKIAIKIKNNWENYKTYGWQLTSTDENIQKQGSEITQFFDIYENSFK